MVPGWPELRFIVGVPPDKITPLDRVSGKPICVGLTCWLWERRERTIAQLAQSLGVTLKITQHIHGLHREIECQVSGKNVDRFIGEFVRRC
jgi:hypothetical protein